MTSQQWSNQLHEALITSYQRILIDCAGDLAWCQHIALGISQNKKALLVSDQQKIKTALSLETIPAHKSIQLLGQEYDIVIYDAFSGLDADALVRVIGLIKAPGLLLFLRPPDKLWLQQKDPKNIWQNKQQGHSYFTQYILQTLHTSNVITCHQTQALKRPKLLNKSAKTPVNAHSLLTRQQQKAWDALQALLDSKANSLAIIGARGRGKSTLLGRWLNHHAQSAYQFIVTSDSKKATQHCLRWITKNNNVRYVALDQLLQQSIDTDCIIVDEAATIPIGMLQQLKKAHKKIVYTSTIDGYEGTGQGFTLQFLANFKKQTLQHITLKDPMRWGHNDLLEQWLHHTFLLEPAEQKNINLKKPIQYDIIKQKSLNNNRALLEQILQLLKTAHYRSQASDLKTLLNNPHSQIFIAHQNKNILGILILNAEGGLSADITQAIYYGKRRPQGHLLAQSLTVHGSYPDFAQLTGFRIQRIAVCQQARRRGIGSSLITQAITYAQQHQADYIGAIFALDEQRLNFWQNNALQIVMISIGQGTSTGKPSVTHLKPLTKKAQHAFNHLQNQIKQTFSQRLLTHFKTMPAKQVKSLLAIMPPLAEHNVHACETYINGFKGFEYALYDLRQYVLYCLQQKPNNLTEQETTLLIQAILQVKPWTELISQLDISGKKALNTKLKNILKTTL